MTPARFRLTASAPWAVAAAFGTYFCMYGFRKPFTAATTADYELAGMFGVDYKTALVLLQTVGYLTAKIVGIRVVSEMRPERRAVGVVTLIASAQISLLGFGLIPSPYNSLCLFFNGLALGMVFGLVMGFLEGRRVSEALVAGLCMSFILADGAMKSLGKSLLDLGVSATWMPATAGGVLLAPTLVFIAMLSVISPPNRADVAERALRPAMTAPERRAFLARFGLGLLLILTVYMLVTILRSVRADFAPEIVQELGINESPLVFTRTELWVALGVGLINGLNCLIRDNRAAFYTSLVIATSGFVVITLGYFLHRADYLSGFAYMVLLGIGLYCPYVAVHTTVFERLIAMTRQRGNVGFLMYLADSCGYFVYAAFVLAKSFNLTTSTLAATFLPMSVVLSVTSVILLAAAMAYFSRVGSGVPNGRGDDDAA